MKPFLNLAYAEKIGFTGQFLIEPKPKEPTKHQYDYGKTLLHTLNKYDWFLASRNKCPHSCSSFSLTTVKVDKFLTILSIVGLEYCIWKTSTTYAN